MDYQAEPGVSPTARLRKLVSFLETGDAARAGIELEAYEDQDGDPVLAAYWREQIHGDPGTLFEDVGKTYTTRQGESLSSISRKFLGDPLRFYALARFNEIGNPSKIVAGQEIKIPVLRASPSERSVQAAESPGSATVPDPKPDPDGQVETVAPPSVSAAPVSGELSEAEATTAGPRTSEEADEAPPESAPRDPRSSALTAPEPLPEAFDEAAQRAEEGELESAIVLLEDGLRRYPGNQKVRRAAVLAYARQSEALVADGKPEEAAASLARAAALDPNNQAISQRLQAVRNRLQAEAFYEKGLGLRDGGNLQAALAAFGKALEIAPDYPDAKAQFSDLQSEAVDQLQRQAIDALRQEDYPAALALWERILAIDPTNGTADRYHKHTRELLSRGRESQTE